MENLDSFIDYCWQQFSLWYMTNHIGFGKVLVMIITFFLLFYVYFNGYLLRADRDATEKEIIIGYLTDIFNVLLLSILCYPLLKAATGWWLFSWSLIYLLNFLLIGNNLVEMIIHLKTSKNFY